jgi:pentatricopeptide repeat protein
MEQNKSPFEEIFKKEESRKEEKKEKGILDALDNEEKSLFEESANTGSEIISVESKDAGETDIPKERRYRELLNELVKKRYFEEAISIIGEMKEEFKN